jgi:AmmeMemoRadiSam system protein A
MEKDFHLTSQEQECLLSLVRDTIRAKLQSKKAPTIEAEELDGALGQNLGCFVTLHHKGHLRGCIGTFSANQPLYKTVSQMALAAAFEDPRFPPLTLQELDEIDIEISVLSPLVRIHSLDQFKLGTHGIYIRKGNRSGTFLPQVAKETGWSTEEFLGHCSQDKAGLGWDGWKDAELYVYSAYVFGEQGK